ARSALFPYTTLFRSEGVVRQPGVGPVDLVRLLPGVDLELDDLPLAAVGLLHRGVEHLPGGSPEVGSGAVAFDEGDDRVVGNVERAVGPHGDLLAFRGWNQLLESRHGRNPFAWVWAALIPHSIGRKGQRKRRWGTRLRLDRIPVRWLPSRHDDRTDVPRVRCLFRTRLRRPDGRRTHRLPGVRTARPHERERRVRE